MKNDPEKLTARQEQAILALLQHPTREAAAKAVGVNSRTIRTWAESELFKTRYSQVRREVFGAAVGRLAGLATAAVETLGDLLASDAPAHVRVTAARTILEQARAGLELDDLAERVIELEGLREHLRAPHSAPTGEGLGG